MNSTILGIIAGLAILYIGLGLLFRIVNARVVIPLLILVGLILAYGIDLGPVEDIIVNLFGTRNGDNP